MKIEAMRVIGKIGKNMEVEEMEDFRMMVKDTLSQLGITEIHVDLAYHNSPGSIVPVPPPLKRQPLEVPKPEPLKEELPQRTRANLQSFFMKQTQ